MQSQASLKTESGGQKRETQRNGSRRRIQPNVPAGFGDEPRSAGGLRKPDKPKKQVFP